MLSIDWVRNTQYLDQMQLHQEIMSLIWAHGDPEKIAFLEEAERERMGVENFIAHQYGPQWPVHKTYSTATDDTPTGFA